MKKPKVTVLTSLYNCRQYIEGYFQCIASIEYSDELEILLLHNAPTEEELHIIQSYLPSYPFLRHYNTRTRRALFYMESRYQTFTRRIYYNLECG